MSYLRASLVRAGDLFQLHVAELYAEAAGDVRARGWLEVHSAGVVENHPAHLLLDTHVATQQTLGLVLTARMERGK